MLFVRTREQLLMILEDERHRAEDLYGALDRETKAFRIEIRVFRVVPCSVDIFETPINDSQRADVFVIVHHCTPRNKRIGHQFPQWTHGQCNQKIRELSFSICARIDVRSADPVPHESQPSPTPPARSSPSDPAPPQSSDYAPRRAA